MSEHENINVIDNGPPEGIENHPQLKKIKKCRLSVKETIYYQPPDSQGQTIETYHAEWLLSGEQPYTRYFQVTDEWQPLDCGWIDNPALIVLRNESGKQLRHSPTEEEQAEHDSLTVEIAILFPQFEEDPKQRTNHSPPKLNLPPLPLTTLSSRESFRLKVRDVRMLVVRSVSGEKVRCLLNVYPH